MDTEELFSLADKVGLGFIKHASAKDIDKFKQFAALVVKPWADQLEVERKKFQELNDIVVVGMQHARIAEREACAKVCEDSVEYAGDTLAEAIRARGQA